MTLIEKLEAAKEGNRLLDTAIVEAMNPGCEWRPYGPRARKQWLYAASGEVLIYEHAPHYTTSIDAALTLVPNEEAWLTIRIPLGGASETAFPGHPIDEEQRGKSGAFLDLGRKPYTIGTWAGRAALAICIAALRARA